MATKWEHSKAKRRQLASSELLVHLGMTADRWGREVTDQEPGVIPFAEWEDDEPLRTLCRKYGLSPTDLAGVLGKVGERLEAMAMRSGYDEIYVEG